MNYRNSLEIILLLYLGGNRRDFSGNGSKYDMGSDC